MVLMEQSILRGDFLQVALSAYDRLSSDYKDMQVACWHGCILSKAIASWRSRNFDNR
jgi:hypothetical protein